MRACGTEDEAAVMQDAGTDVADGGPVDDGVAIATMRRRHLRGVVSIEQRTNHRPWSHGLFLGELRMPTSRSYVVALARHRVLGFAGLMLTGAEGHITNIAVDPDHRRRHLATRMMLVQFREAIRMGLDDLTLEVRMSNTGAQEMYRRFGFAPGGVRRNYYSDIKEDALIMWAHGIDSDEGLARLATIARDLPVVLHDEVTGER
jgi:ribosomal-protein-alanine N-acetyltransferase